MGRLAGVGALVLALSIGAVTPSTAAAGAAQSAGSSAQALADAAAVPLATEAAQLLALGALGGGASTADDGGSSAWPMLLAVAALVIAAIAVALLWSRRPRPAASAGTTGAAGVDDLLEVSRRLTTAATAGDIDRAVVREALGLVPADGGALVYQDGGVLTIGHESRPGLLVPDALGQGTVRRVAETGQQIVQVSATEPAIRNLPASVLSVPLVGGGRVEAVVVLVRSSERPFTPADAALIAAMAPVAAAALHSAQTAQAAIEDSLVDPLTGVGNRRRLDADLTAALIDPSPTALAIVDLDHFKTVNDTYGHQAGDAVLMEVVRVIRESVRPQDSVYRFGGEEFCILMRHTELAVSGEVAERVRAAIDARAFAIGRPDPLHQTASFGVAVALEPDAAALVARADSALYEAKESGRNQVVVRQ